MAKENQVMSFKEAISKIENYELREQIKISGEIHKARNDLGISQLDLSEMSGVPQKTISRIETGESIPNFKTIIKLAKSLGKEIVFELI